MIENELILALSSMGWDHLWLRNQELMVRFARAGNRVLFVEPIGIRMPKWEDRQRVLKRVRNRVQAGTRGIRVILPNLWGVDPIVNPFQEIGFVHRRNAKALTAQLQNAIEQVGGGTPIIWTSVPTRLAREVIGNIPHKALIFDCEDALTENPKGVFASFAESEKQLSREADLVLVTSPKLMERQQHLNANTRYAPHAVEYAKFALDDAPEPESLRGMAHPRLTFFGGIDERVNLELLRRLAERHPEWQLVLMGMVRTDIAELLRLPNVHYLGHIPHNALPPFLVHCDVMLLPYRVNSFSQYINPAKLFECLAVGKPTIASALPIFGDYRTVVDVAGSDEEFERMVVRAVAEGKDRERVERRRACARENTWEARFAEINGWMQEVLERTG